MPDVKLDDLINKKTKDGKIEYEITIRDEDKIEIEKIKNNIKIQDDDFINNYGNRLQIEISKFSQKMLDNLDSNNNENTIKLINSLVENIDESSNYKRDFIQRLFGTEESIEKRLKRYENIKDNVNDIKNELEIYKIELLKDIAMLDILYEENLKYFKQLDLYIIAGEEKIKEIKKETIENLYDEANQKDEYERPKALQSVKDYEKNVDRFEEKLLDMKTTKIVAMQTAPQIKLIQNNNQLLVNKITDSINNVIPLYKAQLIILLGLKTQKESEYIQQNLSDMTNNVIKKNSNNIKNLKELNDDLVDTLNNTIEIQDDIDNNKKDLKELI